MISEVFVSRRHAEIRPEGSDFVIHPVGSTPTLVNDIAIYTPRVLREGDIINIGTMRFTFTRDRLPVAMQVADPWLRESRLYDEVNERRPTLTFPVQTVGDMRGPQSGVSATLWLWIALIIVALIVAYFVFDYYATM
jgi:pSer/pThr/pTyr-binding forkhead associated (FHA) protein